VFAAIVGIAAIPPEAIACGVASAAVLAVVNAIIDLPIPIALSAIIAPF
jgi:hypothetical protein